MTKYKIIQGRWDEATRIKFVFEAESDETAKIIFDAQTKDPSNAWDKMALQEIDSSKSIAINKNYQDLLNS